LEDDRAKKMRVMPGCGVVKQSLRDANEVAHSGSH
jgi:hypothetical protein